MSDSSTSSPTFPIRTSTPINVLWADPLKLLGATINSFPSELRQLADLCRDFQTSRDRLNVRLQMWMLGVLTPEEFESIARTWKFSDSTRSTLDELMRWSGVALGQWEHLRTGIMVQHPDKRNVLDALYGLHQSDDEPPEIWERRLNRAGLPGSLDARDIFSHEMNDEFLEFMCQPAPSEASALGETMFEVCLALPNVGRPTTELVMLHKNIERQVGPLPLMLTMEHFEILRAR